MTNRLIWTNCEDHILISDGLEVFIENLIFAVYVYGYVNVYVEMRWEPVNFDKHKHIK